MKTTMPKEVASDKSSLFSWLLERDIHEFLDTEGRPIGEGRSEAYANVETTFKSCPYPGSRHKHEFPMNASALSSINPEWQKILLLLGELSQRYQAYKGTSVNTFYDLALVSGTGVFLSDFMALRHRDPIGSDEFPVLLTGLYKVCLGFQQATFLAMMNDQFKDSESDRQLPDANGFYQHLEAHELLIGEGEVCGGSSVMIRRAYETMRGKNPKNDVMAQLPQLAAMKIDWEAYDSFTSNASNLWRKAILYVIQMRGFNFEIKNPDIPNDLLASINANLNANFDVIINDQSGLAVEIAKLTIEESELPLSDWISVQSSFLKEINYTPAQNSVLGGGLARRVITRIEKSIELSQYRALVEQGIHQQVSDYQQFDSAVLKDFNQHLENMQMALGETPSTAKLVAEDLSTIYGKTISNW
jgi:hypothetical protein